MLGVSQDQPFPGARAGEVGEISLAGELPLRGRAQRHVPPFQFRAIRLGQQHRRFRRRGKNRFVQTQHQRQLDVRVAGTVNGPNQHLVQRGRNDADRQAGQPRFEDGQPIPDRQCLLRKRQLDIFEPPIHLFPNGAMHRIGHA